MPASRLLGTTWSSRRRTGADRKNQQRRRRIAVDGCWRGRAHSTFWTCSRNFSSSAFRRTISREMRLLLALEPSVLISRLISWPRKSSAPDRLGGFEAVVKLLEMALQARQFLGHVRPVGEIENLLHQALLLQYRRRQAGLPDALQQLRAIMFDHPRHQPPHARSCPGAFG